MAVLDLLKSRKGDYTFAGDALSVEDIRRLNEIPDAYWSLDKGEMRVAMPLPYWQSLQLMLSYISLDTLGYTKEQVQTLTPELACQNNPVVVFYTSMMELVGYLRRELVVKYGRRAFNVGVSAGATMLLEFLQQSGVDPRKLDVTTALDVATTTVKPPLDS